jgi:formylglycine-generating enzyme required for sulfatase activity
LSPKPSCASGVPAGGFLMGSTDADGQAEDDEKPQHTVYLDAFWIDRTEVTNAQYRKCVEAGTCEAPVPCPVWGGEATFDDQTTKANHPVVCVRWYDAAKYCQWAGVRLPTEAEWEKAARGTDGRVYPWGNSFDGSRLDFCDSNCQREQARTVTNASDGYSRTAPVGSYPAGASPYGLLDMAGNVWEWVNDWYDSGYYGRSPARNPPGPDTGQRRVIRGGSWNDGDWRPQQLRAAYRGGTWWAGAIGSDHLGFRCACSGSEP